MPEFPKVNEKFYRAGMRSPSLKTTLELIQDVYTKAEAAPPDQQPEWRAVESLTFSLMVGFLDGVFARLR